MAGPLRIAVFASGAGGNLGAALRLAAVRPRSVRVAVVVTDRPRCAAVAIARRAGLPVIGADFTAACGRASDARTPAAREAYRRRAEVFHDRIDSRLARFEELDGPLDLIVLSYARWVHGRLLGRFAGRMINQHPGDLTLLGPGCRRLLVGNDPVLAALRLGRPAVRASTFFVDAGEDAGAIVCQGPALATAATTAGRAAADRLEAALKRESEWPSLICALTMIAAGAVRVEPRRHPDGSAVVSVDGVATELGGVRLPDALDEADPRAGHTFHAVREALRECQELELGWPG